MPDLAARRPYYSDSYRMSFDAVAEPATSVEGHPAVVLDSTYFYPTSGGQPHDTGMVGSRRVLDVRIRDEDQAVLHLLDGPIGAGPVSCRIDWPRRWDHVQQHTGQHILSQSFIRVASAPTIGFHLGVDYVSIDLDIPALGPGQLADAFTMANGVVRDNVAVRAWFPSEDELATITLRKTPEVDGALRVVAIGDFDVSACGGTHVRQTGEVGLIHSLWSERLKRGTRVAFLCGDRARLDYDQKERIVAEAAAALACAGGELPAAVNRLRGQVASLTRELEQHREAALDREASALRDEAISHRSLLVVRRAFAGRNPEELRGLAMRLTKEAGVIALLATATDRTHFVFARDESAAVNLKPALDAALAAIGGGKGGGSRLVQGGGQPVAPNEIAAALDAALGSIEPR